MNVSDLKPFQGKVDIELEIKSVGEIKSFNKDGRSFKLLNAVAGDETGDITLTLWNDDVEKIKLGDKVVIKNGYVSEFKGAKQLSTGKFGSLEVLGSNNKSSSKKEKKVEEEIEEMEF